MSTPKRPLKVFLCYTHIDKDPVKQLHDRLVEDDVNVWMDKEKLFGGSNWEYEIRKAVRDCDIFVVCVSVKFTKQFNLRTFSQTEVGIALDEAALKPKDDIYIIPVRLEECKVPKSLGTWHWVDLFESDGYQRLIRSLNKRIEQLAALEHAQSEHSNISIVVSGNVQGNIIVGDNNTAQVNIDFEKAQLEAEELARQKAAKEKAEKEAAEKARLEAEELARQKAAKEKIEREVAERANRKAARQDAIKRFLSKLFPLLKIIGVIGVIAILFWIGSWALPKFVLFFPAPKSTMTQTIAQTLTLTPAALPDEITDDKGVTMRLVPAGYFIMGSENGNSYEKPVHQVYLDDFYMDKYEVTNALYKACEDKGGCTPPQQTKSYTHPNYYGNSEFDNYPVIYVDWNQAAAYCKWRSPSTLLTVAGQVHLPTEAQWEKTARGWDGRIYPWGNDAPNKALLNYTENVGDTTTVGSYGSGKSPYGIDDLAGNVWEWTADWYSETYYQNSPSANPLGSDTGKYRVLRGGSWGYNDFDVRSVNRLDFTPGFISGNIGFRCAGDAKP